MKHHTSPFLRYYFPLVIVIFMCFSCKVKTGIHNLHSNDNSKYNQYISDSIINDIDGNTYSVILVGHQMWMGSNLKTTRYNNGKQVSPKKVLTAKNMGKIIAIDTTNNNYGNLYNYHAIYEGNLCPEGWHIPDNTEWIKMIDILGGECNFGNLSKSVADINLHSEMGGIFIPENLINPFSEYGKTGYWWTSSNVGRNTASYYQLRNGDSCIQKSGTKENNFLSVRCVKDNP